MAQYKLSVLALMQEFRALAATNKGADLSDIDGQITAFASGKVDAQLSVALSGQMSEDEFWALVSKADAIGRSSSETVAIIENSLKAIDPPMIERFQEILFELSDRAYRWDLWAAAYAVRQGCGDDEFDYFREWLILQGKGVYQAALDFAFNCDPQSEGLASAAPNAYRAQTGREIPPGERARSAKPAGEAWREEDLVVRYPALANRFAPD